MSLRAMVTIIESIATPSTWKKYDANGVPAQLSEAKLPILVLLQSENEGGDLVEATFQQGSFDMAYTMRHLLVYKPLLAGRSNTITALGEMIDFEDSYLAAAKLLIGQFDVPPRITARRQPSIEDAGVEYFALEFVWHLSEYL